MCTGIFINDRTGDILGLGGSSVISRLFGEQRNEEGRKVSAFCFYAALLLGVFVIAVMLIFYRPILAMLGADSDTFPYASSYYRYLVLGAPFIILTYTPSNQLRAEGLAKESMTGTILGAVVNMILDPVMIFGLNMGAAGAAIATVIGNICAAAFFTYVLKTKSKKLSVDPREMRISGEILGQILVIGIPASITNLMQSIGTMIMNRSLLAYGNDKIAAMGIVMKINMIAILVIVGFSFGAQPLIGYNYGSGDKARLKKILSFAYRFECILALVLSAVLIAAAEPLIRIFMDDANIVSAGVPMLRLQLISMVFVAIVLVTTVSFQSTGKALGALLLSVSRQGIIFIIVITAASRIAGFYGIIASQAVSDALTALLAVVLYRKMLYSELQEES